MRFGSLFAGIGGMDIGLERAGMTCSWQVEIDSFCQKVLTKHWPDVPKYNDVREVGKHNLEPVDLIAGGFPCQDISVAGEGAGLDGKQSGLWFEMLRIVCELRPRYILVENVSALLQRGLGRVLGGLAASGYDAEWRVLSARQFGAAHRRERLFILAYSQRQGLSRHQPQSRILGTTPTPHAEFSDGTFGRWSDMGTVIGRLYPLHGISVGMVRRQIKPFGNAVVPQVAEWIGRRIMEASK